MSARVIGFAGLLSLLALAPGCSPPVSPVEGTCLLDDQPFEGATVNFVPVGDGKTARGKVDAQGKFVLETDGKPGAPAGKYKVLVFAPAPGSTADPSAATKNLASNPQQAAFKPPPYVPAEYSNLDKTPFQADLPSSTPLKFNISTRN